MVPAAPGQEKITCTGCPAILYVRDGKIQWSSANGQRAGTNAPRLPPAVPAARTPRPMPAATAAPPLAEVFEDEAPPFDDGLGNDVSLSPSVGTRFRGMGQTVSRKFTELREWLTTIIETTPPRFFKLAGAVGGGVLVLLILLAFLLAGGKDAATVAASTDEAEPVAGRSDQPATTAAASTQVDHLKDDAEDDLDDIVEEDEDVGDWSDDSETAGDDDGTEVAEDTPARKLDKPVVRQRRSRKSRRRSRRSQRRQRKLASGPTPIRKSRGSDAAQRVRLQRARKTYKRANRRLFAGDTKKAIKGYRLALKEYPRFVASYRGLGLAYMQQGKDGKALRALRTYVRYARRAKDVPLINKRIRRLQRKRKRARR